MKVYTDITEIEKVNETVLTLGSFDGIHIGHQLIIDKLVEKAKNISGRSLVITFSPHPRKVLSPNSKFNLLTTIEEKIEIFEEKGVDGLLVLVFDESFSKITSKEFLIDILYNKIGIKEVVIGYDHKFGKNRDGDKETFEEYGSKYNFNVETVGPITIKDKIVSSSLIRRLLENGEIIESSKYLGRNYKLNGIVTKGAGRGKTLGFPTANLEPVNIEKLVPKRGVYIVKANVINNQYFGIMNIGKRPTFDNDDSVKIETHLFNMSANIYGEEMEVQFLKRLRDEIKFENEEDLIKQIEIDKNLSLNYISSVFN